MSGNNYRIKKSIHRLFTLALSCMFLIMSLPLASCGSAQPVNQPPAVSSTQEQPTVSQPAEAPSSSEKVPAYT